MNEDIQGQIAECVRDFKFLTSEQQIKASFSLFELIISAFQNGHPENMQNHRALEALSCIAGEIEIAKSE